MEGCLEDGNAVLTREQAKKQPCPLMPTTKIYEYHANGAGIAYEAIEYGKCTDQRQCSQCHSAHRNAGNDIDSIVFLLGEEITPSYVEGKVHFNNSSIFSR